MSVNRSILFLYKSQHVGFGVFKVHSSMDAAHHPSPLPLPTAPHLSLYFLTQKFSRTSVKVDFVVILPIVMLDIVIIHVNILLNF
jgi:hypothetical protein